VPRPRLRQMSMALEHALEIFFPPRCAGCSGRGFPFCAACSAALITLEPPWCDRCGAPLEAPADGCSRCPPRPIASARAPLLFDGPARAAILRLKFSGWKIVARALAGAMVTTVRAEDRPEAVTWVPLARDRRAQRGYDQAEALAMQVARRLELPAVRLLRRVSSTDPQARRSARERRSAMRGAFAPVGAAPRSVLLVDDVLTTGATAAECASVLAGSGATGVHLLTAARSIPGLSYTRLGPRPGLWLPGENPRKSMPAAGETTHVRRRLVAEHGAV
jgi:ComF family protein